MSVETHWICDVCGGRVISTSQTKDVNESGIKKWFVVNLSISKVRDSFSNPRVYKYGYACSEKCLDAVIDWMKKASTKEMKRRKNDKTKT